MLVPRGRSLLVSNQLVAAATEPPRWVTIVGPLAPVEVTPGAGGRLSATAEIDGASCAGETLQGLATQPRIAGAPAGTLPFAEVDMRTSIRPTVAEIDLAAIQRNLARVRQVIGPGVQIFGVVKADAYGHGAVPVARALEPLCSALAVSLVEEGMELRAAGIRAPIVVLGRLLQPPPGRGVVRAAHACGVRPRRAGALRGGGEPARVVRRRFT